MTNELDFYFQISEEDVRNYARMSGDWNPVHMDEGAAKEAGFKACVAHGMLNVARALSIMRERGILPESSAEKFSATFHRPILVGEDVNVRAVQSGNAIKFSISAGESVAIKGTITI